MAIARLLVEHKQEILKRWRLRVGKKLAGGAIDRDALVSGWSCFLDELAQECAKSERGEEHLEPPDGSAHGAQRLRLGFDASEIVRETGILHVTLAEVAREHDCAMDAAEERLLLRSFYALLATAVGEHGRRRDADVERETVDQLGQLAGDYDGSARGTALRELHAWAQSRSVWPAASSAGRERFSLASVLADAVADVRDSAGERGVPVLVDLATPIEVQGERDLLRRAIVRVLRSAVAATRRGGSVVARAQMLSGGRARIDIQDECGGGGVVAAGHCLRPAFALAPQRSSADWSIVRGAIAANRGTVHARKVPGVGCVVTIDVPGQGDEEPCCNETAPATTGR
ncbi:MAG: RsbRD N-terminal domain-containing protein [Myxococcales bacterium]|nr:RsbRD N-terminal domain-containing protein [Myxococcales bacterium]